MLRLNRHVEVVLAGCLLASPGSQAQSIVGEWVTPGYAARVQLAHCPDQPQHVCGAITWLWEPSDRSGKPVVDAKNPDPTKRSLPLVGLQLLADFSSGASSRSWTGGRIYNPEDGRTYKATLTLREPDLLEVEGCVLVLCSRQVWRRLPATCAPTTPQSSAATRGPEPVLPARPPGPS